MFVGFTLIEIKGPKRKRWQKLGYANPWGLLNATRMRNLLADCVKKAVSLLQRYGLMPTYVGKNMDVYRGFP